MKHKICSWFVVFVFWFFSFYICFADSSNVQSLIFISQPQTIQTGEISTEIKVQTQNSTHSVETVSETNDVTFSSTSLTGEFLNSSGGAASKTMSKNTSSRTFYYRDTSPGTHTLTLEIKGRDSGKTFSASQDIIISNNGESTSTSTAVIIDTTASTTNQTASSTQIISPATFLSSHTNTVSITYVFERPGFKIDAGRERLVTVGMPVEFEASVSGDGDIPGKRDCVWSFGDGKADIGKKVVHYYKFPGDYNVVLNADSGREHAVSRTRVKVINPEVNITSVMRGEDGFVELQNNSNYEVNINDWKIIDAHNELILAPDTIIDANSKIKIPFSSFADDGPLSLVYGKSKIASVYSDPVYLDTPVSYNNQTEDVSVYGPQETGESSLEPETESISSTTNSFNQQELFKQNIPVSHNVFDFIKNFFTE